MSTLTGNGLRELMAQEKTTRRAKERATVTAPRATENQLRTVFGVFDTNGNGNAAASDLHLMCLSVGVDIDQEKIPDVLAAADAGQSGLLTFDEFDKIVKEHAVAQNSDEEALRVFGSITTCLNKKAENDKAADAEAEEKAEGEDEDEEKKAPAPATEDDAMTFEALKAALFEADARVSDDEIKEVIKYCGSLSGDGTSIAKKDWLEVMQFVREVGQ
jgi:hypothetical protein